MGFFAIRVLEITAGEEEERRSVDEENKGEEERRRGGGGAVLGDAVSGNPGRRPGFQLVIIKLLNFTSNFPW